MTGSIIEAYTFCPRQAWLMSHQITGNQYNEFLAIGRLISEESYKSEKREIITESGKIDIIKNKNNEFTLIEVKKSSKFLETAELQLLFYLYHFSKKGYKVKGEIRIPKEKKVFPVILSEQNRNKIETVIEEIQQITSKSLPPQVKYTGKCKNCSYLEFCWS